MALIHKLLKETPSSEVEWILYMDPQTLFDQPSYVFNFEFYAGRDLVLPCALWPAKKGETGAPRAELALTSLGMAACVCHALRRFAAGALLEH